MLLALVSLFVSIMAGLLIGAPILWTIFGTWFVKPLLGLGDLCFASGNLMACLALLRAHF